MPEKQVQAEVRYITRLNPAIYDQLVSRLPAPLVNERTTELQAGYQLGVQAVLAILRQDLTIGE